ncbi:MAG: glycosyltransferase family 4 protein [Pyrinomonadaceae bacterium]
MTAAEKRLRIVQIGPMPPPHGGVSTNMLAIHETLAREGHESRIIDVTDRNRPEGRPYVLKPRSAAGLLALLARMDADVLHYHIGGEFSLRLALLTIFCGLLPGKCSVVTFHSGGFARGAVQTARPFSIRGVAFRMQDRVVGVNPEMTRMFVAYGVKPDRIRMIVPFELKAPDESVPIPHSLSDFVETAEPLIVSVGSLESEYRHRDTIAALSKIIETHPGTRLLIAGSGPMRDELQNEINIRGHAGRVLLAGNVERDVLLHLNAKAGVLLRITDFDGDSISVREGLFLGTPVVATDNGMRPKGTRLVEASAGPEQVASAVIEAIKVGRENGSMREAPESNAAKVIALYEELIFG